MRFDVLMKAPKVKDYFVDPIFSVCAATSCTITTTKTGCTTPNTACISWLYAGTYTYWTQDPATLQPLYFMQVNPAVGNWFMAIYFVPEINMWTVGSF